MSTIQIENGYVIITANEGDADGISAVRSSYNGFDISFDTEEAADALMDQLAVVLCGKWLSDDPKVLLS